MHTAPQSVGHYENFPVASVLLPRHLRRPVAVIYAFARSSDDFADEGDFTQAERLASLESYRQELRQIETGQKTNLPLFTQLAGVIKEWSLPLRPFYDLLDAFSQDVLKARYADFGEVMHYCSRSADPVGRLMLHLYGAAQSDNIAQSDSICSALQLINFWQDVEIDFRKDRIYLPQDELARFGVTEELIAARKGNDAWRSFMTFQSNRTRRLLLDGAPLGGILKGRIGLEMRMIIAGGDRILSKIAGVRYNVLRRRPVLRAWDWPLMLLRTLSIR